MLQYGNPPDPTDCVDLGTVPLDVAPKEIENAGIFAGDMALMGLYGTKVPPQRRVWLAISYFRDKDVPVPWRATIPGLGELIYTRNDNGSEDWKVLN